MDKNKRNNIIKAIAAGAVYAVFFKLTSMIFSRAFPGSPYNGITVRVICTAFLLILVFALHRKDIFKNKTKGFLSTFAVAGIEIGVIALGLLQFVFSFTDPNDVSKFMSADEIKGSLVPAARIAVMITEMLLVGISEELIARGLVLSFAHEAFGSDTKKGAYLTAALSGMVFGCLHLLNLFGTSDKGAVLFQVFATACVGFYWGAVFLRKRNIFALMLLHAVSDITAFLSKGFATGQADTRSAIDSTNAYVLILAAVYVAAGMYLLRDEKMHCSDSKAVTANTAV